METRQSVLQRFYLLNLLLHTTLQRMSFSSAHFNAADQKCPNAFTHVEMQNDLSFQRFPPYNIKHNERLRIRGLGLFFFFLKKFKALWMNYEELCLCHKAHWLFYGVSYKFKLELSTYVGFTVDLSRPHK